MQKKPAASFSSSMVVLVTLTATIQIKLGTTMQRLLIHAFKDNKQNWCRVQSPPDQRAHTDSSTAPELAEVSFVWLGWAFVCPKRACLYCPRRKQCGWQEFADFRSIYSLGLQMLWICQLSSHVTTLVVLSCPEPFKMVGIWLAVFWEANARVRNLFFISCYMWVAAVLLC